MAKKGQAVQLQAELTTDDEWTKFLERDGLLLVDIYSEWSGPCAGMVANLKKIKLEIGGDLLQLAIAKSDNITVLERFRNKSEPTWMFIVNSKMVNFMYGANAPTLLKVITDELKKENEARAGQRERTERDITEMADDEKVRYDHAQAIIVAAKLAKEEKIVKELVNRRTQECKSILENLSGVGVILIFPHAKDKYKEVIDEGLTEAALNISSTDKVRIDERKLKLMYYFLDKSMHFNEESENDLLKGESLALLIKSQSGIEMESIESTLLKVVYGPTRDPLKADHPLMKTIEIEDEEEATRSVTIIGIWTPPTPNCKALALEALFPKLVENFIQPEPEEIPPHLIIAFDALRRKEIMKLVETYAPEILRYGFFTSEVAKDAKLVSKTFYKYEKNLDKTLQEKIILQVSKKKSECVFAFAQITPTYISANAEEGEKEAKIFFPEDYDEPPDEDEEVITIPDAVEEKKVEEEAVVEEMMEEEEESPVDRASDFSSDIDVDEPEPLIDPTLIPPKPNEAPPEEESPP